jgi:tetratricopeptide (TPR) repeat protein
MEDHSFQLFIRMIKKSILLSVGLPCLALLVGCETPGASEGRSGNDAYADSSYDEAATAYRNGLRKLPGDYQGPMRSKLFNNTGATRYRQQNYRDARSAFEQAAATARNERALVRALYNGGNAAQRQDSAQTALTRYRSALMTTPDHRDAKFNYEFVKRNLPESQKKKQNQQQKPREDIKPSKYARKLKKQADEMVARKKYRAAHQLLEQGLRVDRTVRAFQSFMKRLEDVANIDEPQSQPSQPPPAPDANTPSAKT